MLDANEHGFINKKHAEKDMKKGKGEFYKNFSQSRKERKGKAYKQNG